jgi:hypothetical protein
VNDDRNKDEIAILEGAFEGVLKLAKMALDEWPEQTVLSPHAKQGEFLYVQALSAAKLAVDYLILRRQPDSLGFKILARHIYENHINASFGACSPEQTGECLLSELNGQKKKLNYKNVMDHEGLRKLAAECDEEIAKLKVLFGDGLTPRKWEYRAEKGGLGPTTYFYYRHLCGYAHAGYSSWRPFEASLPDPSLDRMVVNSVAGTSRILHEWTNQCILEDFLTVMRQVEELIDGLP